MEIVYRVVRGPEANTLLPFSHFWLSPFNVLLLKDQNYFCFEVCLARLGDETQNCYNVENGIPDTEAGISAGFWILTNRSTGVPFSASPEDIVLASLFCSLFLDFRFTKLMIAAALEPVSKFLLAQLNEFSCGVS